MSDAPSITDTLTHPTITNETSPHFAEALWLGYGRAASQAGPLLLMTRCEPTEVPEVNAASLIVNAALIVLTGGALLVGLAVAARRLLGLQTRTRWGAPSAPLTWPVALPSRSTRNSTSASRHTTWPQ